MNTLPHARLLSHLRFAATLAFCLGSPQNAALVAQQLASKEKLTPTFWQRDPAAGFEDEGRMHCAPTSVSDGLIYLSKAFRMRNLVPGTEHIDQIKLIRELAEEFHTDPKVGGTNPDKLLTGLQNYISSKDYELSHLELMTWRGVSNSNEKFKKGSKPQMPWIQSAVSSENIVVIFNFGWYHETKDAHIRKGGHWVVVVGSGPDNEFTVHNPILSPEKQADNKSVKLTLLEEDFVVNEHSKETNMKGYYEGEGSGLPHGDTVTAILDAVIVFGIKK